MRSAGCRSSRRPPRRCPPRPRCPAPPTVRSTPCSFLDRGAHDFFVDRDAACAATAALLRAEVGREPDDRALRELVGELSTLSPEFRGHWAAHDVLIHHDGVKLLRHPDVGRLELTFQSLELPRPGRAVHELITYTAEPGTASEDRLELLAIRTASPSRSARESSEPPPAPRP
ncbi:MmyB family transcriptional regulator [Actinacidiphila alni]|uniref:MmyB family transcriptional regulator n=1 Tax=Actinacidiphila alni TaxID=380248 RepID=UPI0015A693A7|nr:DNA-binding protein [Actinacidiphila alni]